MNPSDAMCNTIHVETIFHVVCKMSSVCEFVMMNHILHYKTQSKVKISRLCAWQM